MAVVVGLERPGEENLGPHRDGSSHSNGMNWYNMKYFKVSLIYIYINAYNNGLPMDPHDYKKWHICNWYLYNYRIELDVYCIHMN